VEDLAGIRNLGGAVANEGVERVEESDFLEVMMLMFLFNDEKMGYVRPKI
jgi:hypothetical protein